ncbi:MAG: gamma-glutamyltransferase [Pseudomonadota bacterium]
MKQLSATFTGLSLLLAVCADANAASFDPQWSRDGMVATTVRPAAAAGAEILAAGGNAVDAAIATSFAAAVAHPYSSGIGGGLFAVSAVNGEVTALDAREVAPAGADAAWLKENPQAIRKGPHAVAVPGFTQGLAALHQRYGSLPWEQLVAPAIRLAEEGVVVSGWHYRLLQRVGPALENYPETARIYLVDGAPPELGYNMVQRDLGKTLRLIQRDGGPALTRGATGKAIVEATGGLITLEDLAGYSVSWREPLRGSYRGYEVVSMPPPSSGGLLLIQMLNMLEGQELKALGWGSSALVHRLAETMKLAYADRAKILGDASFDPIPVSKLTGTEYAARQAARIRDDALVEIKPIEASPDDAGTTHISVMDRFGNAVALTQTINGVFGSYVTVPGTGIVLNNEMDDFAVAPRIPNEWEAVGFDANRVEPGKRPLSSMTPTLLLQDGRPVLSGGAAMGTTIITSVLQTILGVVDFDYDIQQAIMALRVHHQWFPEQLMHEPELGADARVRLESLGHELRERPFMGGAAFVTFDLERCLFEAGIDGRRDSGAVGIGVGDKSATPCGSPP